MKILRKNKNNEGYLLIELLFYFAFLAILTVVVINSLIAMTGALREVVVQTEFTQGGMIMEKIIREIKQAKSISSITSTDLKLNSTDANGNAETVEFIISNSNITYSVNGATASNLNTSKILISSSSSFLSIPNLSSAAVKIVLNVQAADDLSQPGYTQTFYDTAVLRGSYVPAS